MTPPGPLLERRILVYLFQKLFSFLKYQVFSIFIVFSMKIVKFYLMPTLLQIVFSGKGKTIEEMDETFLQQLKNFFETMSNALGWAQGSFLFFIIFVNKYHSAAFGGAPGWVGYLLAKLLKKDPCAHPRALGNCLFPKCFKMVAKMSHPLFLWSCPFPDVWLGF